MKANKYQELSKRSLNPDLHPNEQLINAVLGLAGETGEICSVIQQSSEALNDNITFRYIEIMSSVGLLGDVIKKAKFHKHPIDSVDIVDISERITQLSHQLKDYALYREISFDLYIQLTTQDTDKIHEELGDVQWYISQAAYAIGSKLKSIMKRNIRKLAVRYAGGFSYQKSINREK